MPKVSIIIPVKNEEQSVATLWAFIEEQLVDIDHEVIFIDDGSDDNTLEELKKTNARVIVFRRNFGKSAALMAGFRAATGDIIITMDGDLQDDPNEIPRFMKKLDEGYDLVVGWKKDRKDPVTKTVPSKFFNWMTSKLTGVDIHDANCGFKCMDKGVVGDLYLRGELHRYIPALAHERGHKVTEIPVKHHPRRFGKSKYGVTRLVKGFLDLLTVLFLTRFMFKPAHFFGIMGLSSLFLGIMAGGFTVYRAVIGSHVSAPAVLTALFIMIGLLFILFGLLAELTISKEKVDQYEVKEVIGNG